METIYALTYRNRRLSGFYPNELVSGVSGAIVFSKNVGYSSKSLYEMEELRTYFIDQINNQVEFFKEITFPRYKKERLAFIQKHNAVSNRKERDDSEDVFSSFMKEAHKCLNILKQLKITEFKILNRDHNSYITINN